MSLKKYNCESCGKSFLSHPDSNAAERILCSPKCELNQKNTDDLGSETKIIKKLKDKIGSIL